MPTGAADMAGAETLVALSEGGEGAMLGLGLGLGGGAMFRSLAPESTAGMALVFSGGNDSMGATSPLGVGASTTGSGSGYETSNKKEGISSCRNTDAATHAPCWGANPSCTCFCVSGTDTDPATHAPRRTKSRQIRAIPGLPTTQDPHGINYLHTKARRLFANLLFADLPLLFLLHFPGQL